MIINLQYLTFYNFISYVGKGNKQIIFIKCVTGCVATFRGIHTTPTIQHSNFPVFFNSKKIANL